MSISSKIAAFIFACLLATAASAEEAGNIGILSLETSGKYVVPVVVWYPTDVPTEPWQAGPYTLHATRNAPLAPGRHALILLSHGSGGGEFGHADLAEELARHGYIVAAPRHLGDSYDQPGGRGSDRQMIGRPWQSVATLDAVLADPRLKDAIDAARIGMAGFSAGGYTTLVMAGATPDFTLLTTYCGAHADDKKLCSEGAESALRITRLGWKLPTDRRVRAAVAMAPLGVLFDAKGVSAVSIPLRVYKASDDHILRNPWNADHLLSLLPPATERGELPGGHYIFLAPCSAALRVGFPEGCTDAAGIDRTTMHARLNAEIVDFFNRTLTKDRD